MISENDIQKLRSVQLEIADEIHRICVKYNIIYYMAYGTLLGAVRHKGIIPWDYDIDIAMPRKDYLKFKEICKTELSPCYIYRDFKNIHNYDRSHALISKKNTELHYSFEKYDIEKRENLGIYVDIFPLDHAPFEKRLQIKQNKKLNIIVAIKRLKSPTFYSFSKSKRLIKLAIKKALFILDVDKINYRQQEIMQLHNLENSGLLCSMSSPYPYENKCMPEEIYGQPQLMEFEHRMFYAPARPEEYLKRIYGDYMKLPPTEERSKIFINIGSVKFNVD